MTRFDGDLASRTSLIQYDTLRDLSVMYSQMWNCRLRDGAQGGVDKRTLI